MSNRDTLYEKELNKQRQTVIRILDAYAQQKDWSETDILAIQRALQVLIESMIGLARYFVKLNYSMSVNRSREAFDELKHRKALNNEMYEKVQKMIGFRNILVHDYLNIDDKVVRAIVNGREYEIIETVAQALLEQLE